MVNADDTSTHWLFGWLDSHRINTVTDVHQALGSKRALGELREVAEEWRDSGPLITKQGINLVAGTGLRLDDLLTCPSLPCRQQQIDVLFRHAWHYFDKILLPDGVGYLLHQPPDNWNEDFLLETLESWIASVMYIRELGAEHLVSYYPRFLRPPKNFLGRVTNLSAAELEDAFRKMEADFISLGKFKFEQIGDSRMMVDFLDQDLGVGAVFDFPLTDKRRASQEEFWRAAVSKTMMENHVACLAEDLHSREHLKGTLGSIVWSHDRLLSRISAPSARDVVLRLSLPSISGIPVKELISFRRAEGDSFSAFRAALTKAAQDMISQRPSDSTGDICDAIISDVVRPELMKLEQKMNAARRTLTRKTIVSLGLGFLAAKCGLLLGLGPIGAGAAGLSAIAGGTGNAGAKYFEDKQALELSDMYFLWKALDHA